MHIVRLDSYEAISKEAASLVIGKLKQKNDALLCAATGNSPLGMYTLLKKRFEKEPALFSRVRIIKLDEWGGVPMNYPGTCENFLQHHLIGPLKIDGSRYISFESKPKDPNKECVRIKEEMKKSGPIDICILGLGINGHLALNEPGEYVESGAHVVKLSETSLTHSMVKEMGTKPSFGLTLGMTDILQSAFILLIISGIKKREITAALLERKITTQLPASFLWLHSNVVCLIDREAYP